MLTVFNGCQKENPITKKELPDFVSSKYVSEFGKYQKELLVFDATKENSILVVCHSENEDALNQYLNTTDLELIVGNSSMDKPMKSIRISKPDSLNKHAIPQALEGRMVSIDLITYNLKPEIKGYSLSVKTRANQLKSVGPGFSFGSHAFYKSSVHANFIGVWHYGNGWGEDMYDCYCYFKTTDCMLCSWNTRSEGLISDDYLYWGKIDFRGISMDPFYKLGIEVYNDSRATTRNYEIAYTPSQFYSHSCAIGSYDSRNCYVGSAPSGTTAFYLDGHLYYTPINGNQCPLPGSSFDTINCYVMDYPSNSQPFISGNSWYVKPMLIDDVPFGF